MKKPDLNVDKPVQAKNFETGVDVAIGQSKKIAVSTDDVLVEAINESMTDAEMYIREYNPGITDAQVAAMLEEVENKLKLKHAPKEDQTTSAYINFQKRNVEFAMPIVKFKDQKFPEDQRRNLK